MFPELRDYLDEVEATAESTGEFLRKLNGARRRLSNKIAKSNEQVKLMKDERKYVAELKPQIIKDAIKVSKDILFNNTLAALRINKEFDDPVYRVPLFEAIESNDTYLARATGTGFDSKISVDINLDKSAGRLNMWAAAVKAVRVGLGVKIPKRGGGRFEKSAIVASRAWRRYYTSKSQEWSDTIESRLQASAKIAPFWSIINFGTTTMASDRGGYPTPTNRNTNFVDKAEREIKSAVAGFFDTAKENHRTLFNDYNKFLDEALATQARLDEMANDIRLDLKVVRGLERQLGVEIESINRSKLEKAVELIRKGLLTQGRVDITARGSRRRVRPSVSTIREALL
jgi:hypothetical protein